MGQENPGELATFGETLRMFRKRAQLHQEALAKRLGVHRNTIVAWENGSYLPATRGLVMEIARVLHLDYQETLTLLQASLIPPKAPANNRNYDIAISYATEDREFAVTLADSLIEHKVKVFFDDYEKANLWGRNLYTHLTDVYQNQARYCVIFISKYYATKVWTTREREAAQARALREQEAYILPIRLDDTEIPGLLPTIAYLDWTTETAQGITRIILQKLGKE